MTPGLVNVAQDGRVCYAIRFYLKSFSFHLAKKFLFCPKIVVSTKDLQQKSEISNFAEGYTFQPRTFSEENANFA